MKGRRILILVGGHWSTCPRAQKEALALAEAGCDVEVGGVWFDPDKIEADRRLMRRTGLRFTPALDFNGGNFPGHLRRFQTRWRGRMARLAFAQRGKFSPDLLGYGAREMLDLALSREADLTIVHSEAGLWVANELLSRGYPVGVDFEDWFSRDLPTEQHNGRPAQRLELLERRVTSQARYVVAPSHAMAAALSREYGGLEPTVIYNSFPAPANLLPVELDRTTPSIHWFSQNIGSHRGLELLFRALPLLKYPASIHLRGSCNSQTRAWLHTLIPAAWRQRVMIVPPVPASELAWRIAEHDIGLALEGATIPSRNLSVSNKVFQYLQSGLAVVATPTAGQREVLDQCSVAGTVLTRATAEALAAALNRYLAEPEVLAAARQAARQDSQNLFSWEAQKTKLLARGEFALEGGKAGVFPVQDVGSRLYGGPAGFTRAPR